MKKLLILSVFALYSLLFTTNNLLNQNIGTVSNNDLYNEIVKFAEQNDIEAQESSCDLVWKVIPGLNGRSVDVDASYEEMKEENVFNEDRIIYVENTITTSYEDVECSPIYRGNTRKQEVSFIINVAWGEEYIDSMLETLDKYDIKANFFIEGNFAKNNIDTVSDIYSRGHLIGNHSLSHSDFSEISKEEMHNEILETNNILSSIALEEIKFFGPPSGSFNNETLQVVNDLNMNTVLWNVDTIDWQNPSKDTIIKRVVSKVDSGSIVLMHPTKNTAAALEEIILQVTKKGLKIERLDELLSPNLNNHK